MKAILLILRLSRETSEYIVQALYLYKSSYLTLIALLQFLLLRPMMALSSEFGCKITRGQPLALQTHTFTRRPTQPKVSCFLADAFSKKRLSPLASAPKICRVMRTYIGHGILTHTLIALEQTQTRCMIVGCAVFTQSKSSAATGPCHIHVILPCLAAIAIVTMQAIRLCAL